MRIINASILICLVLGGCGYFVDGRNATPSQSTSQVFSKADLSYANVKQEVLARRCENCHGERNPARGLDLSSYDSILRYRAAIERTVLRERSMPPRGVSLNPRELGLIRAWFKVGLPEGGEAKPTPEPTPITQVDFPYIRDVIFAKHACFTCHAAGSFPADIPLNTVEDLTDGPFAVVVKGKPAESKLLEILETTDRHRMPPVASDPGLTPEEIKLIRDWIERL